MPVGGPFQAAAVGKVWGATWVPGEMQEDRFGALEMKVSLSLCYLEVFFSLLLFVKLLHCALIGG